MIWNEPQYQLDESHIELAANLKERIAGLTE